MSDDRDPDVAALLERHTPDAPEAEDWARVVRDARRPRRNLRRGLRRVPAAAGVLGLFLLVGALIVATPDDPTAAPSPPAARVPAGSTLRAYLRGGATARQIDHLRSQLVSLREEGRIASFTFESKEVALERLRARLRDPSILDELPSNPLPASFEIEVASGADPGPVVASLSAEPAIDPRLGTR